MVESDLGTVHAVDSEWIEWRREHSASDALCRWLLVNTSYMALILFCVALISSTIGAICGIGGGVIIKPVLDATGWMSVSNASFLSGCMVLSMTAYSVARERLSKGVVFKTRKLIPISIGAAAGGLAGKTLFQVITRGHSNATVGVIQAICLIVLVAGTIVYTMIEHRFRALHIEGITARFLVGLSLGALSAFLGIGGGPFNLLALSLFFSLREKEAVISSLFIILIAQVSSLLMQVVTRTIPDVPWTFLLLMISGGVIGGMIGRKICSCFSARASKMMFVSINLLIIGISCWNIYQFLS